MRGLTLLQEGELNVTNVVGVAGGVPTIASLSLSLSFFFFQAEDGIRDLIVTGVQTCALPISGGEVAVNGILGDVAIIRARGHCNQGERDTVRSDDVCRRAEEPPGSGQVALIEIGRASCRERV